MIKLIQLSSHFLLNLFNVLNCGGISMKKQTKYIFTSQGTMEDKLSLFTPPLKGMTKYEVVILLSKRAREINQLRIELQKKYKVNLVEKEKPIVMALKEYLNNELEPVDSYTIELFKEESE
jgi:DNA-directed RNA polymerase subunit K/omega